MFDSAIPWTAACQFSLSFTISLSLLRFMSIESVMVSNHHILCHPLLILPSIFPSIMVGLHESHGMTPMSQHVISGSQSIGASSKVLPMNIQGQFPLGFTSLISLLSKEQESSPAPKFESISSLVFSLLYGPALTSIHEYWKY